MTEIVAFHETELLGERENNVVWIPIKPICEAIGVHADKQLEGLRKHPLLSRVHALRRVHDASGRVQEMLCLPIQYVHGWLFSIDPNRINSEIRPALILYQEECYQALYDHFFGNSQQLRQDAEKEYDLLWRNKEIDTQIRLLMAERRQNSYELKLIQNRRAAIYHRPPLHEGIEEQNAGRKLFGQQLELGAGEA